MIGVLSKEEEIPVVEEFFQLFKTPWEHFVPGKSYAVLLVTTGRLPSLDHIKTVFVFSSEFFPWEADAGLIRKESLQKPILKIKNESLPIYGEAAVFSGNDDSFAEWEGRTGAACLIGSKSGTKIIRMGFDLFREVSFLLQQGQPPENAAIPTLDLHIRILRNLILEEGIPVVEIPPVPPGVDFISCLTHDIDFVYLRQHLFDHTMWGFLYRATIGSLGDFLGGRKSFGKLFTNWMAALKLPFVHLGCCTDFWQQFGGYLKAENGKPSTFFVIPFKGRSGKSKTGAVNERRATRYDVGDISMWTKTLRENNCEVALHGIDAWTDLNRAREESQRIESCTGQAPVGVRMHWLYFSEKSPEVLDEAGFDYDSTCGFNESVGYRAGTSQPFKPIGVRRLMELPMHIQDTALFYPGRMHLTESDAWKLCMKTVENSRQNGGVLTVLWHDRSLAPERLWGDFYAKLLAELQSAGTWFGTAREVVSWFRERRDICFRRIQKKGNQIEIQLEGVLPAKERDFSIRVSWLDSDGRIRHSDAPLCGRTLLTVETSAESSFDAFDSREKKPGTITAFDA